MDFLDLDDDGQPDSGTTGNENGGRVSYIHYAEPFPEMVDLSHVGYSDEPVHLVTAAVEVLSTHVGTGIIYLLDTTEYTIEDGQFKFKPKLIRDWEIPYAEDHCYGEDCEAHPNGDEWLLFSPHKTVVISTQPPKPTKAMAGDGTADSTFPIIMQAYGLSISRLLSPQNQRIELQSTKKQRSPTIFHTARMERPLTRVTMTLDGSPSFGRLSTTTASHMHLVSPPAFTLSNLILTFPIVSKVIV
jgi:hypothetical protein